MKLLFDFFPVALFFLVYKFFADLPPSWISTANMLPLITIEQGNSGHAILFATLVIILATILQNALYFARHRRFEKMHLITLGILLAFGSLTLLLQDPMFIKWKVSIVNWVFAVVFLASRYLGSGKTIAERIMSQAISAPAGIWKKVNMMWVLFFVFLGILNLIIVYKFNESFWVNFKLFGVMGLTFVFVIIQVLYLHKHAIEKPES